MPRECPLSVCLRAKTLNEQAQAKSQEAREIERYKDTKREKVSYIEKEEGGGQQKNKESI